MMLLLRIVGECTWPVAWVIGGGLCCETLGVLSVWIEGDQEGEIEILRARRLRELLTGGEDDGVSKACEEEEARA